MNVVN